MLSNSKILVITILVHVVGHALGHVPFSSVWLLAIHVGAQRDTAVALGLQLLTSAQRIVLLHQRWRHRPLLIVAPPTLSLLARCLLRSRAHKSPTPQLPLYHRTSRSHPLTRLRRIHRSRLPTPNRPHPVPTSSLVPLHLTPRPWLLPKLRLHLPLQRRLASLLLLRITVSSLRWPFFHKRIFIFILILHSSLVFIILLLLLVLIKFSLFLDSLFFHLSVLIFSLHHVIVV